MNKSVRELSTIASAELGRAISPLQRVASELQKLGSLKFSPPDDAALAAVLARLTQTRVLIGEE